MADDADVRWMMEAPSGWEPMRLADSARLEAAVAAGATEVLVHSRRVRVNLAHRTCVPVYWNGEKRRVRRGLWFARRSRSGALEPLPEEDSSLVENLVLSAQSGGTVFLSDGTHQVKLQASATPAAAEDGGGGGGPGDELQPQRSRVDGSGRAHALVRGLPMVGPLPGEEAAEARPDVAHLVLVVHGIGEAVWSRNDNQVPSIIEGCRAMRDNALELAARAELGLGETERVEFLPVEWYSSVHDANLSMTRQLTNVTLPSVDKIRAFINNVLLDIMLYETPHSHHAILTEVARQLNRVHGEFRRCNPDFGGRVLVVGHSLGSIISFDLLAQQGAEPTLAPMQPDVAVRPPPLPEDVRAALQLDFRPDAFVAMGSPIALFTTVRGLTLSPDFHLPACPHVFNVFHPTDPVASRIEPLVHDAFAGFLPALVPHSSGSALRAHVKLQKATREVQQTVGRWGTWMADVVTTAVAQAQKAAGSSSSSSSVAEGGEGSQGKQQEEEELPAPALNRGYRIDFALQTSIAQETNPYLSALTSHTGYWESTDVALFVVARATHADVDGDCVSLVRA